jgi:hypothetical protein
MLRVDDEAACSSLEPGRKVSPRRSARRTVRSICRSPSRGLPWDQALTLSLESDEVWKELE